MSSTLAHNGWQLQAEKTYQNSQDKETWPLHFFFPFFFFQNVCYLFFPFFKGKKYRTFLKSCIFIYNIRAGGKKEWPNIVTCNLLGQSQTGRRRFPQPILWQPLQQQTPPRPGP
jgi:hypothetical protein